MMCRKRSPILGKKNCYEELKAIVVLKTKVHPQREQNQSPDEHCVGHQKKRRSP